MGDGGIHLLLVEDNPGDTRLVRELLRGANGISIDAVDCLSAAKARLSAPGIDIVLLDLGLRESQGLETLARVRTQVPALPIVVLTGIDDEDLALEAVKAGAQDYLVKGRFDADSLPRAIRYATERGRAEKDLHALALRNEAILAAVPDIIAEVDENKVYTWVNRAGLEFFGEGVIGKETAFYFEGGQDTCAVVQPLFDGEDGTFYVESRQRRQDGEKRLLGWWCRALKDAQGNVRGALSTARDITERRRAEKQMAEQLDELRRWHKATLGRETRVLDLKREVNELLAQTGKPPRYHSTETEDP